MLSSQRHIVVLLIDKDPVSAELFSRTIAGNPFKSFHVQQAHSLETAKKLFAEETPDIIIADPQLPESDGLETVQKILKFAGDTPLVILTNPKDYVTGKAAMELGAQSFLPKTAINSEIIAYSILQARDRYRLLQELKQTRETLERLAVTDPLTGLFNRSAMERILNRELGFKQRYGAEFYGLLLNLDDFENVNLDFGRAGGDLVLKETAVRIRGAIRKMDYAARIGSDEFLILLAYTQEHYVAKIAERIRAAVAGRDIIMPDTRKVRITCSGGCVPIENTYLDEVIKKARALMQESKKSGKNQILLPIGTPKKKKTGY